jgi:hypothetical protein
MSMEKIIGSLVGVNGHTFDIVYDLFFTTERVIAVIIRHPADNPRQFTSVWQTEGKPQAGENRPRKTPQPAKPDPG